jgi:prepilin-type N-terminal cleavage/methylation domain-containing protein
MNENRIHKRGMGLMRWMAMSDDARCGVEHGFTLIEVLVTLVVISVLAFTVVGVILEPDMAVRPQAELIKAHLRFARSEALASTNSWGIQFQAGAYTLQRNGVTAPVDLPGQSSPTLSLPSGVQISGATLPLTVTFNTWGSPGGADISFAVRNGADSNSVTVLANTGYIP